MILGVNFVMIYELLDEMMDFGVLLPLEIYLSFVVSQNVVVTFQGTLLYC